MDSIDQYKCPSCGAPLIFSGHEQALHCDACGNNYSAESLEIVRNAQEAAAKQSKFDWSEYKERNFGEEETQNLNVCECESCGAEVITDITRGSLICPYCDNTIIIKNKFEGGLRPDFVIPFKIEKKDALAAMEKSCKGKKLLPSKFISEKCLDEIIGIYIPFWAADCSCSADVTYNASNSTSWTQGDYRYTKTDHYTLYRSGELEFERIPADASSEADDAYMDALEPYDYSEAVSFNTGYLSGYLATRYDVPFDRCVERINRRVKKSAENKLVSDVIGKYQSIKTDRSTINSSQGKLRYALMPVWMLNIRYGEKIYKFAVNGQTGKLIGEYPISKLKTVLYFLKVFLISSAVIAVLMHVFDFFMG